MHFCAYSIHCRVHWRVDRRLGSCILTSVQPLIGSAIWAFSISSALWALEIQFCLYWHSFNQTDHKKLWWMVVKVNWFNVVSGVPQGSVVGPLLFFLYTSELFSILENKLIVYDDDSTLMAVVPSPGVKVAVAESLIRDLGRVSELCDLWGIKLNASKTKTMIVSRSRTMHHQSPPLTIGGRRSLITLLFWEWHLTQRRPLRSIFARFPEQPLNHLVPGGRPGECSMIDSFWKMLSGSCPASFGVLFCSLVLGCRYTP